MKLWMQTIANSTQAEADFQNWIAEIHVNLLNSIKNAARNGEMDKLAALAIELSVYDKLGNMLKVEKREERQVIEFNQIK